MYLLLWLIKKYKKKRYFLEDTKLPFLFLVLIASFILYIYYGTGRSFVDTIYYTSMIMTTVGFGDITPDNDIEKIIIVLFMGIGITSLGYLFGFVANKVSILANLKLKGLKKMKKDVSLLIIGYPSEQKVKEIIEHIRNDEREEENIVCLNNILEERPEWMREENITFIKGIGSDKESLIKANAKNTDKCLILANDANNFSSDDYSSSAATIFLKVNETKAKLLIEVVRSDNSLFEDYDPEIVTTFRVDNPEVISQEILDPGAFQLKNSTFSTKTEGTQFNIDIKLKEDTEWSKLAYIFIINNCIPEGFKEQNITTFNLLPKSDEILKSGENYTIKYRGKDRIDKNDILGKLQ